MTAWRMWKGHGTENDFLVLPDLDDRLDLTDDRVRRLCDRRAGIGADGVLRVVRAGIVPDLPAVDGVEFAMDYRNADGSIAEMCGNGLRVFVRYLQHAGLVGDATTVSTRGGAYLVQGGPTGELTSAMGAPTMRPERPLVSAPGFGPVAGVALEIPNPHVVVPVTTEAELDSLELTRPPLVEPALPHGQNVEFVVSLGPRHLRMRVHERGVGETRSCGTGICAAVVATAVVPDGRPWRVDVPGGTCTVTWPEGGPVTLTGPAVLIGTVDVDPAWLG